MNVVTTINFKTKTITTVDLTNKKATESIPLLNEAQKQISQMPQKSALLITDVTGTEITQDFINATIDFAKKNTPYVKASATVGNTKMIGLISMNVGSSAGRKINNFNSRAEAMDWLAKQP